MVHAVCCTPRRRRVPAMQQFSDEFNPLDVLAAAASLQSAHDGEKPARMRSQTQDHSYAFLHRDMRARADTEDDGYCSRSSLDSPSQWSRSDSDAYEQDVFETADLLSPVGRRPAVASPPCCISPRAGGAKVIRNTAVLRSLLGPREKVNLDELSPENEKAETDSNLNVWFTIAEPKRRNCLDSCYRTTPLLTDSSSLPHDDSPENKGEETQSYVGDETVCCSIEVEADNVETVGAHRNLQEHGNTCLSPLANSVHITEAADHVENSPDHVVSPETVVIESVMTEAVEEAMMIMPDSHDTLNVTDDCSTSDVIHAGGDKVTTEDSVSQYSDDVRLLEESPMTLSQGVSEDLSAKVETTQPTVQQRTDSAKLVKVKVVCLNNNIVDGSNLFILSGAGLNTATEKGANEDKPLSSESTTCTTKYPYIIEDDVSPVTKYGNVSQDVKNDVDTELRTDTPVSLQNDQIDNDTMADDNSSTSVSCRVEETVTLSPGFVTYDTCGESSSCDEDPEMAQGPSSLGPVPSSPIVTTRSLVTGSTWISPIRDMCNSLQKSPVGEQINVKIAGGRLIDITRDGSPTSLKGWTCTQHAVSPVMSLSRKRSTVGAFIPITGPVVSLPPAPRRSTLLHPLIDHDYGAFSEFSADIQSSIIATTESKLRTEKKYTKKTKAARTTKAMVVPIVQPEPVVVEPVVLPVVKKRKYIRRKMSVRGAKKKKVPTATLR